MKNKIRIMIALGALAMVAACGAAPDDEYTEAGSDTCLWAVVDPKAPLEQRDIVVIGTGHEVPEGALHLGTVLDGSFVWHVFERRPLAERARGR